MTSVSAPRGVGSTRATARPVVDTSKAVPKNGTGISKAAPKPARGYQPNEGSGRSGSNASMPWREIDTKIAELAIALQQQERQIASKQDSIGRANQEISSSKKKLPSINREIEKKRGILQKNTSSWCGWTVHIAYDGPIFISLITRIITKIFFFIFSKHAELHNQHKSAFVDLQKQLEAINKGIKEKNEGNNKLKAEIEGLSKGVQELRTKSATFEIQKKSYGKIFDFFRGPQRFEAIPEVEGASLENADSIDSKKVTAPVMRGIDKSGRVFFVIRAKEMGAVGNAARIHAVFQTEKDSATWSHGHKTVPLFPVSGMLIGNDGEVVEGSKRVQKAILDLLSDRSKPAKYKENKDAKERKFVLIQ